MSDNILVLPDGKGDIDNLEPRDLSAEQVSLAYARGEPKTSHDPRHAGKTFLEQRMEEFERYLFMTRVGSRQSLTPIAEPRKLRRF